MYCNTIEHFKSKECHGKVCVLRDLQSCGMKIFYWPCHERIWPSRVHLDSYKWFQFSFWRKDL